VELAAHRLVQECLTNAAKHGGEASVVEVSLAWRQELLRLTVRNAVSAAPSDKSRIAHLSSGHGLQGLQERINLVGGTFAAGPVPGGFDVAAELPRSGSSVTRAVEHRAATR